MDRVLSLDRYTYAVFVWLLAASLPAPLAAQQEEATRDRPPVEIGLVEEVGRRLVQLDVSVSGPREVISELTREDFEVIVGGKHIKSIIVDDLCKLPEGHDRGRQEPTVVVEAEGEPIGTPVLAVGSVSYLFYFDQNHLTLAGRIRALDMTRDLVRELVVGGNKGMIISSGRNLRTFAGLTEDQDALLAALDQLEQDLQHWWDPTQESEDARIGELLEMIGENVTRAITMAKMFALEERWRTEKSQQLLSLVLGRMADLPLPKAVVYYADTMRSNAGAHYMSYFNFDVRKEFGAFTSAHAFDRVLEEANALGIRFYSIKAQGLVSDSNWVQLSGRAVVSLGNNQREQDAENSLASLALESGGKHFLHGARTARIAREIREDLSCLYLISFDAGRLRQDSLLPVRVRTWRPKVRLHVRGQVVVQSESKKLTSRLMAAFASPEGVDSEFPVHGVLIPTGYEKGKYSALVQLRVPGSPLSNTSWDLGLSLVARGQVLGEASGRLEATGPGLPVVLEAEMSFKPGPYRIVLVAHEISGNQIGTGEVEGDWPDPNKAALTVGPIAVMQPLLAAFLRDDDLRRSGAVGIAEGQPARTDRPTALVGLVCRGKSKTKILRIERRLVGHEGSYAPFEDLELDLGDDRCVQIRDVIRAGSMSSGSFRYEVRILDGEEELASSVRKFLAATLEEISGVAAVSGSNDE